MKTSRLILMLLAVAATSAACEKNAVQVIAGPREGGAAVKFFNFSVGSPQVNFYANNAKVTAVASTGCYILDDTNRQQCLSSGIPATTGIAYGSAGNGASAWYSDMTPGQVTLSGKIAVATDNGLPISSLQTTVQDGKFYSYYLSGVYNATSKTTDSFIVEDVMPPDGDFTVSYLRFVNTSSTATGPLELWLKERTTKDSLAIGGPVAYKSAGAFVSVPVRRALPDSAGITGRSTTTSWDLTARYTGNPAALFSRSQLSFGGNRAYTITARGDVTSASTMALDNTANR